MTLLTCGNKKLGPNVIWHFDLPSKDPRICQWATKPCWDHCYMNPFQKHRPLLLQKYESNFVASQQEDFEERILAELKAFQILVCRPHCSGEFYSLDYARKWLRIMKKARKPFFYFYSRSWQDPEIAQVFAEMAALKKVLVYWSLDQETGVPIRLHPRIRFAWLQTQPGEEVPDLGPKGLIFRTRRARRKKQSKLSGNLICPHENGSKGASLVTCQGCQVCLPSGYKSLMSLV